MLWGCGVPCAIVPQAVCVCVMVQGAYGLHCAASTDLPLTASTDRT
jgi:hypothetical protein